MEDQSNRALGIGSEKEEYSRYLGEVVIYYILILSKLTKQIPTR